MALIEVFQIPYTDNLTAVLDALNEAKKKGAIIVKLEESGDPFWDFKTYRFYKIRSDDEIKAEKIKFHEMEIEKLKNGKDH